MFDLGVCKEYSEENLKKMEKKKYFICFKPEGDCYVWLKLLSSQLKDFNPNFNFQPYTDFLHLTFHKPVYTENKNDFLKIIKSISKRFSSTNIVLSSFGVFDDNIVIRVSPTHNLAKIWVAIRLMVSKISSVDNDRGSNENTLHFTVFTKISNHLEIKIVESNKFFPPKGLNFPIKYICLFEKIGCEPWVEIKRLPLKS